jgi:hypothetical protein
MLLRSRNSARQTVHQVAKKKRMNGFFCARRSALVTGIPSTPLKLNEGKNCPGFSPTTRLGVVCTKTVGVKITGTGVDEASRTGVFVGAFVIRATGAPDTVAVVGTGVIDGGAAVATASGADGATSPAGTAVEVIGNGWTLFRVAAVGGAACDLQADTSRDRELENARLTNDRRDGCAGNCPPPSYSGRLMARAGRRCFGILGRRFEERQLNPCSVHY